LGSVAIIHELFVLPHGEGERLDPIGALAASYDRITGIRFGHGNQLASHPSRGVRRPFVTVAAHVAAVIVALVPFRYAHVPEYVRLQVNGEEARPFMGEGGGQAVIVATGRIPLPDVRQMTAIPQGCGETMSLRDGSVCSRPFAVLRLAALQPCLFPFAPHRA